MEPEVRQQSRRIMTMRINPGAAPARFDYGSVDTDIASDMREVVDHVHALHRAAVIEVGRALLTVKGRIEQGHFVEWVEHECGMHIRGAQRAMAAAEMVEKNDNLSYLPADGLVALSARTAPEPIVSAIIERIDAGEKPSASEIKGQIAKARREAAIAARQEAAIAAEKAKLTARRGHHQRQRENQERQQ